MQHLALLPPSFNYRTVCTVLRLLNVCCAVCVCVFCDFICSHLANPPLLFWREKNHEKKIICWVERRWAVGALAGS